MKRCLYCKTPLPARRPNQPGRMRLYCKSKKCKRRARMERERDLLAWARAERGAA